MIVGLVLGLLVGLVIADADGENADRSTRSDTPTTTAATSTTESAPTTTVPSDLALGETAEFASGARVTVYAYQQPVSTDGPQPADAGDPPGYVWAAADAEVCAPTSETLMASNSLWVLTYADNTRAEPSSTGYGNFPEPGFPFGGSDLLPGTCLRGWITYGVRPDVRPAAVVLVGAEDQPRWAVT